ncbi:cobyric acid synthase [Halorubrum sp. JWXQ-INN 858]|uniref:cobyric acid synthase n=1 Tax=Halorubrum sp. JWXQ-INN 858 TaxID=2690782 RepID=UPI0013F6FA59|nr:cobyric acid synthase [Halorubrum sp. JWXQ-INN 858]MWV65567.1 cobyric acid synthase [Halorubrum sp. JWXQ-INN 858]
MTAPTLAPGDARTLLVAGTASHVGKSTVVAGLCRLLSDAGVAVAPFKAQNMSNNARAVPTSGVVPEDGSRDAAEDGSGDGFGEIGVSQYVQARAARVPAETDHNPVLLKPRGEGESQLVVDGRAVAHYAAGGYYDAHWHDARDAAVAAHRRLAADADVVVAEGAGSIAEINLHDRDLANVETARFADADVLLVADIERGGVFASLVGTLELLPEDLRDRVVGAVITKFRGDVALLEPGLDAFEARTGVPVLGVIPYDDPGLPEEDSVALPAAGERAVHGADDGVPDGRAVTVAVPRLPRISNATDLEPLAAEPGVRVAYVPLEDDLRGADAVVLPGTKNTVDDLLACREAGFDDALRGFDGPIVGLCGGYQLLGERIRNAGVESAVADGDAPDPVVEGIGLLPVETTFDADKRVVATELLFDSDAGGPLSGLDGERSGDVPVSGYEIHMGETRPAGDAGSSSGAEADRSGDALSMPFKARDGAGRGTEGRSGVALGAATDRVMGTYLHGLFENDPVRSAFISHLRERTGIERPPERTGGDGTTPYDRAADLLRDHVDLAALELPIGDDAEGLSDRDGASS